jgi:trimeric autotransporter adhesin
MNRFRKLFAGVTFLALSLGVIAQDNQTLDLQEKTKTARNEHGIAILVNDVPLKYESGGPREVGGRVLVPMRSIFEALGATVEWNAAQRTVVGHKGNTQIVMRIGEKIARKDGHEIILDQPAQIIEGRTMVPIRFIAESLGADVNWDVQTKTVVIRHAGDNIPPQN